MKMERMVLIDKEIMASNAKKFGKSSIVRAHFLNSTPNNGTQMQELFTWMTEYQQFVNVATIAKMRRFYTFCDVEATNARESSNGEMGSSAGKKGEEGEARPEEASKGIFREEVAGVG